MLGSVAIIARLTPVPDLRQTAYVSLEGILADAWI